MKYFKKLEGNNIYLTPINVDDYETYTKWMNDHNVTDGVGGTPKLYNLMNEKAWIEKTLEKGEHTFGIILKENDELIGNCGLHNIDHLNQTVELGIMIGNTNYHNKGIGQDTLTTLLKYCFYTLNMHNVYLKVYSFNKKAIKCYKNTGFKECGVLHEAKYHDGEYYDIITLEYLKKDFLEEHKEK